MSPAVVFLPDTALLVPGAAGRADPAAGLRRAALDALGVLGTLEVPEVPDGLDAPDAPGGAPVAAVAEPAAGAEPAAAGPGPRVLVIAPGRRGRFLSHPVLAELGGAGIGVPTPTAPAPPGPGPAHRADVPASTALLLLRAAGVRAAVDVLELARDTVPSVPSVRPVPRTPYADALAGIVVVGSLSARHGPDAPAPDDPRAADVDAALLAALATGPGALAAALDDLGPDDARDLAVSGAQPWRVALGRLGRSGVATVRVHHGEVVAGAQHAVVAWSFPAAGPARPAAPVPEPAPAARPEESR